ncbi:MAG: hypothetical protein DYG92_03440 [Leptolyngbya sp. PLA1]|nr:hypothetical protein [Leptolyngbya sp. PLA1]
MRRMLGPLAAVALSLLAPLTAPALEPTFASIAGERFGAWDTDRDGLLSAGEIDTLCIDPSVKGEEAAAVASLKRIIRSGRYAVPPLTREYLSTAAPAARSPAPRADADRQDSGEVTAPTTGAPALRTPNFQSSFASSVRRIRSTKRDLFADETPDLDRCRQGPLGNCYFVAAIGAAVHRDPGSVTSMITPQADGSYLVRFATSEAVAVPPLTDAELALSGTTGDEGLWLPVLEKALGLLRIDANPERYTTRTATDAIANGGSTSTIIRMLTNHQTARITLKRRPRSTDKGPDGKPIELPPVPAGDPADLARKVRADVADAIREQRLVACSTGVEKLPPGISPKHAYAIIAMSQEDDTLTLWNPHGNTVRPRGEPGPTNGYHTRAGVFTVPISEFVTIFSGVVIETDTPAPRPKPAPTAN